VRIDAATHVARRLLHATGRADRQGQLAGRFPPRVRATELWRVAPEWREQVFDDATIVAIRD
jgi:hypothetical protein